MERGDHRLPPGAEVYPDVFPGVDDPRPTVFQPPDLQVPVASSAHLDTYQFGEYSMNDSYGVGVAQVLYVPPDVAQEPGVDRIYVLDWRNNLISIGPELQPGGGGHPEEAVTWIRWIRQRRPSGTRGRDTVSPSWS